MKPYSNWGTPSYDVSRVSVAVCEPNKNMQLLLNQVLRVFGIQDLTFSDDSAQALDHLKKFNPDVLITELRMEPIDGFELVHMIRNASDSADPFLPIIMLTGHTEARNVYSARDTGITEFLAKPVTPISIYNRIVSIVDRPRQFVKSPSYFGPDRRRATASVYKGPERRKAPENGATPRAETAVEAAAAIASAPQAAELRA
jgi:two-component system chemotaxis response regulator CheY